MPDNDPLAPTGLTCHRVRGTVRSQRAQHCTIDLLLLASSFLALVQQRHALPTRYSSWIIRRDSFHLGSMGSLLVASVAQHHAVLIEGVLVALLALVPGHGCTPRARHDAEQLTR